MIFTVRTVRACMAIVLVAVALSACGSNRGEARDGAPSVQGTSAAAIARIERCVDRLLQNATAQDASEEDLRRYTRDTYCARFERSGWIYEDGAMSIEAYIWLEESGTCVASEGDPSRTVPCEEARSPGPRVLDCALLRHIRRSEVRDYLERLQREGAVECDDGTPLDNLGVP